MSESQSHARLYLTVFGALCVLTLLSLAADVLNLNSKVLLGGIVLAIATAKAMFVMAYFMHLKFEGPWKYLLLAPTIILAASIPVALSSDISLNYYDNDPQLAVPASATAPAEAEASSHAHEAPH